MFRIINPFHASQVVRDAQTSKPAAMLTAADRTLLHLFICLCIAAAAGTLVGTFMACAHIGDSRMAAIAGSATFGAVLSLLMVLRMFAAR